MKAKRWLIAVIAICCLMVSIWALNGKKIVPPPAPTTPAPNTVASSQEVKVHFIDVGQADSIYLQLSEHVDILVDAGNVQDGPAVVKYLQEQGVDDLDLLIATHPHEDHIGGISEILKAFKVKEIIDSGKVSSNKTYKNYANQARLEGCPWERDAYQSFTWGGTSLQVLTGEDTWNEVNDYSVVIRLDCGDIEFLLAGDAEKGAEELLPGDISADILKVGHHGGSSSSSQRFLERVNPRVAVISVGNANTYGHPSPDTLKRLQQIGLQIYRTDINGSIVVSSDGLTYSVMTAR
ncbi:MAG: ComEC/Rec2 family competence protein [Syntrophomonadaceae bacterium]